MLELQMGLNRDARRERIMGHIKTRCAAGKTRMYMLVPEQSTFTMSREVCRIVGNNLVNGHIEVIGFKQLVNKVYEECGGKVKPLDDGGRLLAMAAAVNNVKKSLGLYRSSAGRPEFLSDLLATYTTMMLHGVTYSKLREAAEQVSNAVLYKKLIDLSLIFETYEEVCANTALDPATALDSIASVLNTSEWLKGTQWFIDGFSDFPKQQMGIISAIVANADYVMVSLSAAGKDDPRASSALVTKTAQQLICVARETNVDCEIVRTKDDSDEHLALATLQNELCDSRPAEEKTIAGAEDVIRVFADPTPYMECQHIAGTIMRAVRKDTSKPYRYRDISVVLCDYNKYAPILESVFRRYGIPAYFASNKEDIGRKPVMLAVNSALLAATRGMPKEEVLQYLKSGLSNLSSEEVDTLENYALAWNIHGYGWAPERDWDMHPDGYGLELTPESTARLAEVNAARRKGIAPLLDLKKAIADGTTAGDYVEALYAFLEAVGFTEHLQDIVDGLTAECGMADEGERQRRTQMAMEYGQVSEVLNHAMEQMHAVLGSLQLSPHEFVKLFKLVCSAYKIATIPVSLDQVEVFSMEDARFTCSKLRYIAGAEEGKFPAYIGSTTLLDATEVKALRECELEIPGANEDIAARSLSDISNVVSGAKRLLVFSYNTNDPANPTPPSHLVQRAMQFFPRITPCSGERHELGDIYDADTIGCVPVGKLLGRLMNREEYTDIAFQLCSIDNKTLQSVAWRVMGKAAWALEDLSNRAVRGLYGERIPLSATRANTHAACRYHYFLKYGLKLKEPANGCVSSPVFGRFAHQVLEHTLREVEAVHGGFQNIDETTLEAIARKHIAAYTVEKMRGLEEQPERYQYLYKRNCREVLSILRNFCEELQASDFHSAAFELKIGGEAADLPAINIAGKTMEGTFTGITDRIDVCTVKDGRTFFRVVDYKTGRSQTLDLSEILLGMSLQLILYQAALHHNELGPGGTTANPAGMLYVPTKETIVATPTKVPEEKVTAEHDKARLRRGMILDDKAAICAMEHIDGGQPRFLPIKFNEDGTISGDVASAERMQMLEEFVVSTLGDMVDDIGTGNVKANPVSRGMDRTSCTWCPYKAACHKDSCGVRFRYQRKVKAEEFWKQIKAKVSDEHTDI